MAKKVTPTQDLATAHMKKLANGKVLYALPIDEVLMLLETINDRETLIIYQSNAGRYNIRMGHYEIR